MKFLIDNSLSPLISEKLRVAGYDAVHVRDYRMHAEEDERIFLRAYQEDRIVISADTDFGTILALRKENKPSVILFRHGFPRNPEKQVPLLLVNLPQIEQSLMEGSVIIFENKRIRVRCLPIS